MLKKLSKQTNLVPADFLLPIEENFSAPFKSMPAAAARVSTLLTTVGFLYNPSVTGKGGLTSTSALRPSIEAIKAVSSPQIYAPCPIHIFKSKEKLVPRIFSPSSPSFFNELIDAFKDSIDF